MGTRTGRYWIGTIPEANGISPCIGPLPNWINYVRGQLETGSTTGYRHWQLIVSTSQPVRFSKLASYYSGHWELTRSKSAEQYVWKDDTSVEGTRFELGTKPLNRNEAKDWGQIKGYAVAGNLDSIPPDVFIRCYNQLSRISADFSRPTPIEREVFVFWGPTGTGKSRRAWDEAGVDAYPKDPCTKWWCGYRGHQTVVIDEFRGLIGISHLLRWFDRYPVSVELKGSSTPFKATRIFITSNIDPAGWFPDLDPLTYAALSRRLKVEYMG
nr:MAG: replication associated protein [Cressdnaviricota sp.]